jgi:hypothetical protein
LIPISLIGCASTREEHGSVLMEDVIVQRTTTRSTTQNPTPKKNGSVYIQGDNITIGTMIVNSPNARVDNSTKIVQVQQSYSADEYIANSNGFTGPRDLEPKKVRPKDSNIDRDFFKNLDFSRVLPSLIMMHH